jgi:hypothetical protein
METRTNPPADGQVSETHESVGRLIADTIEDASALGKSEVEYVKAEVAEGTRRAATGGALLGAAAIAGLVTIGMLAATATLALATTLPAWLAALIVAVVCGVIGAVLALVGVRLLRSASDEISTTVTLRLREDVQWLKHRLKREST